MTMPVVTLLSDFGTRDGFVAAMKGVILDIAPTTRLVDVAHEIEPGDIEAGAWVLAQYWRLFPIGTVHLAVVDPGVGGRRKAIAVERDGRFFVMPDNGLLTRVIADTMQWRCVELAEPRYMRPQVSSTFHGRDIFAPAAAHLATGVPLDALGPPLSEPQRIAVVPPERTAAEIRGRVCHVDRFGNLITDIPAAWVGEAFPWRFLVQGHDVGRLRRSYSEVSRGELLALIGSLGTVEIAARDGSAAEKLGTSRGDAVIARG